MRIAFALPLLLLGACQVNVDEGNDSTTLQYDENLAENTAADVTNEAERIAGQVSNDVQETGDKVDQRLVTEDGVTDGGEAESANAN